MDLAQVATLLGSTMDHQRATRVAAEKALADAANVPGFLPGLLELVRNAGLALPIRLSAATYLKNHLRRHWEYAEGEPGSVQPADRESIKNSITDVMIICPKPVQAQLLSLVAVIARCDFPAKWPSLLPGLVARLQTQDIGQILAVLSVLHAVVEGYPALVATKEVVQELKYVLQHVQQPLLDLFKAMTLFSDAVAAVPAQLAQVLTALTLTVQIFHCLTAVDLPEFFEDHMAEWFEGFVKFLTFANPEIAKMGTDDEPDCSTELQGAICEAINVFVSKYEEEVQPYLQTCTTAVWQLLMRCDLRNRYDTLVFQAITFLTAIAKGVHHTIFSAPEVLKTLCESVIVPNIRLREADIELFEDNPLEYIRRDAEGSDSDTRRRAACDLVKGLCTHFEQPVTANFSEVVVTLVAAAKAKPAVEWRSLDVAMNLVIALGTRPTANNSVQVLQFFDAEVVPVLAAAQGTAHPIAVATAIKYATTFRLMLSRSAHIQLLPLFVAHTGSANQVIHSYAAIALDRTFVLKPQPGHAGKIITIADLTPVLNQLLTNLFGVLSLEGSKENEYVMKCIMRVLLTAESAMAPLVEPLLTKLNEVLARVAANPTNPGFSHWLFESTAAMIKFSCPTNPGLIPKFEQYLFPIFQKILEADIAEFTPYVFQIFSQLLELHETVPPSFEAMLPMVIAPDLWEPRGNVMPLSRLLVAYLKRGQALIARSGDTMIRFLTISQRLLNFTSTEASGMAIISGIFHYLPAAAFEQHIDNVLRMLFAKLQGNKTFKYIRLLILAFSTFIIHVGPSPLVQRIDAIQPRLFLNLLENVLLPNAEKMDDKFDRKVVAVALTRLLCECPEMVNENYISAWPRTLATCVQVAANVPATFSAPSDNDDLGDGDEAGYTNVYAALHNATPIETDPLPSVPSSKPYLNHALKTLVSSNPRISQVIQTVDPNILNLINS